MKKEREGEKERREEGRKVLRLKQTPSNTFYMQWKNIFLNNVILIGLLIMKPEIIL